MGKISVIIPVYNVEKYLNQCVDSIINQTYKDLEIILVNDDSPDNSKSICEEYVAKDSRVKLINKENGGLSSARNAGLRVATGKYISFIDSDDFLVYDTVYEELVERIENEKTDFVHGDAIRYYSDSNQSNYNDLQRFDEFQDIMDAEDFFLVCHQTSIIYAPVCFNLYKRNLLIDNDLFFVEGIYHEDLEFTPRVILCAKTVSVYKKAFYAYRQREGSITMAPNPKKGKDYLKIILKLDEYARQFKNKDLEIALRNYMAYIILEEFYKYRFDLFNAQYKDILKRSATDKNLKLRARLMCISPSLYYFVEGMYRKVRKME